MMTYLYSRFVHQNISNKVIKYYIYFFYSIKMFHNLKLIDYLFQRIILNYII